MSIIRYNAFTLRSAAILTGSYVAGTVMGPVANAAGTMIEADCAVHNQLELECIYTKGSLTSLEIKVEFSHDGTNWVQQTNQATSGGTTTLSVNEFTYTGTVGFHISMPITANYIRVSAKGTGTVTSSSLAIIGKLGWR